jgi:hypothetical protein
MARKQANVPCHSHLLKSAMAAVLQLKRRLYLRNTPESVGSEWKSATDGGLKCISNTIRLRFTGVERGFYNEQERKVSSRPHSKEIDPLATIQISCPSNLCGWLLILRASLD